MDNFQTAVNAVRMISCDGINKANSGHPGLPLGAATVAFTLYSDFLKFNPKNPDFFDRDRFVLSAGHGSMMLYTLLHLFGYDVSKEDLMSFRQLNSLTPGHPEYKHTPGVEVSTGPLGQGIANAVGMAMAEARLAAEFNRDGFPIIDHYTYCLCGEGCLMEGIGYEASSLAGSLGLGKLILLYDCNKITIEGSTEGVFDENIQARQKALGWHVLEVDGNDHSAIVKAIKKAKAEKNKPSMIVCHTTIGYGSPLAGSAKVHGSPLGNEALDLMKRQIGWTCAPFEYPEEIKPLLNKAINRGKKAEKKWNLMLAKFSVEYPKLHDKLLSWIDNDHSDVKAQLETLDFTKPMATRNSGHLVINKVNEVVDNLFGGSADLTPSNLTNLTARDLFSKANKGGSNVQFGIREHAMGAIVNGIAVHKGLTPYCSTFFVFSDYLKHAIRLSGIMKVPAIYVFTHDSIGVGEDGPTHQPIEQFISIRSIPHVHLYRPCDTCETAAAWYSALTSERATAICLTRQTTAPLCQSIDNALKGGYVISNSKNETPDCIIIASGSEVEPSVKAQELLLLDGIDARVVSMPCMEVFEKQSNEYKESVIPSNVKSRVCVEAGSPYSWYKYSGLSGEIVGMNDFGLSGKFAQLFEKFGFTPENIAEKAKLSIKNNK